MTARARTIALRIVTRTADGSWSGQEGSLTGTVFSKSSGDANRVSSFRKRSSQVGGAHSLFSLVVPARRPEPADAPNGERDERDCEHDESPDGGTSRRHPRALQRPGIRNQP